MADEHFSRLLEKQATLELLDQKLKEAHQLLAAIDSNDAAQVSAGLTAVHAVSQLSGRPVQEIKKRGTAALQELKRDGITTAMKGSGAAPVGDLEKQPLGDAVGRLINNALFAKSVALEFEAQGVPEQQGLVYARNIAKALFGKIDEYIGKYVADSGGETVEALAVAGTVDRPLVQTAAPAASTEAPKQKAGPSKLLVAGAAIAATSVICVAILVLSGLHPLTGGSVTVSVGEFMGRSFGLFAIASVVAALASLTGRVARGKPVSVATPIWWGFLTALIVSTLVAAGSQAEREANMVQYQAPGCEFKVTFPRAPEIKPVPLGDRTFEQANVYTKDAVLRAECVPLASPEAASKAAIREWLENFAAQQGLAVERIRVDQLSTGVFGYLTGSKIVSGNNAKYDVRVQVGRTSLLMLMAGSLAGAYPPPEAEAFFSSVR